MRSLSATLLVMALVAAGCREELGTPDYSNQPTLVLDAGQAVPSLPGTDPFVPGRRRLNIGLFYEGDVSAQFPLSPERLCLREPHVDPLRCYLIFQAADGQLQYDQDTVSDRIEGVLADRFTLTGTPFWGGGVIWDAPTDLSPWTVLAVALKSSDASFGDVTITLQSGVGDDVVAPAVQASEYGYAADGEWHALRIPLRDFIGLDLVNVRAPFLLGGPGNIAGHTLLVDEVYMSQE